MHSKFGSKWAPIISPEDEIAGPAWETLHAMIDQVFHEHGGGARQRKRVPSFEAALLYLLWARVENDPIWTERALDELNHATANAGRWAGFLGLHGGLCGLGWVTHYFSQLLQGQVEIAVPVSDSEQTEDANADIDTFILRALQCARWRESYDAIGGLVGYGVYFLERLPGQSAVQALSLIVNHLAALSESDALGVCWRSETEFYEPSMRTKCPDGYHNLGAAHGIAGIIYLLNELLAAGIEPDKSRALLHGSLNWLIAHQRPVGSSSRFSSWIAPGHSFNSPPAWCYGDFGIMPILLRVGRHIGQTCCFEFAHALLEHCLVRSVQEQTLNSAGLCHGAYGIAHIFNRVYQFEGDTRCKGASLEWLRSAIQISANAEGTVAFETSTDVHKGVVGHELTELLNGPVGGALALLAALTPFEPHWDRLLLLSGREWNIAHSGMEA